MSLLDAFLELFLGDTPEKMNRRLEKKNFKTLRKLKPNIFKKNDSYISPNFTHFLFEAIYPLFSFFKNLDVELRQKKGIPYTSLLIDRHLNEEQIEILNKLDEERINKEIVNYGKKEYTKIVEGYFDAYFGEFSEETVSSIENNYNQLKILSKIYSIGIIKFFQEFDPKLSENNISSSPRFASKSGVIFIDDLEILNQVIFSLEFNNNLARHINLFIKIKNIENISNKNVNTFVSNMRHLKKNNIITLALQILQEKFDYYPRPIKIEGTSFKKYTERFINRKKQIIEKCFISVQENNVDKLIENLFKEHQLKQLEHYNQQFNKKLIRNGLEILKYTKQLECTQSFFALKYKDEQRAIIGLVILKGKFGNNDIRKTMGDSYHEIKNVQLKIKDFDDSLEGSNHFGAKYKRLFLGLGQDQRVPLLINELTEDVEKQAKALVETIMFNFHNLLNSVTELVNSYDNKKRNILQNIFDFDGHRTSITVNKLKKIQFDLHGFVDIIRQMPN